MVMAMEMPIQETIMVALMEMETLETEAEI